MTQYLPEHYFPYTGRGEICKERIYIFYVRPAESSFHQRRFKIHAGVDFSVTQYLLE